VIHMKFVNIFFCPLKKKNETHLLYNVKEVKQHLNCVKLKI